MDHAVDFIEHLKRDLKPYLRQPMTDMTRDAIETTIAHRITEGKEHGKNLIVFDGLQVTGGSADFDENVVNIIWKTDFYPQPRYDHTHGHCTPLGFCDEYDLYIGYQAPFPPTLIARYGDAPGDYLTYNPSLMGELRVTQYGKQFVEALQRAKFFGFDIGL